MNGYKQCPAFDKCTATYRGSACAALRWSYGVDTDPEIVNTTDREKLIELLKNAPHFEQMYQTTWQEAMAGWLINNGVTFATDTSVGGKWISVEDRLPEDDDSIHFYDDGRLKFATVIVYEKNKGVCTANRLMVNHCGVEYLDQFATNGWVWSAGMYDVTHWMQLPEAPNGGMLGE